MLKTPMELKFLRLVEVYYSPPSLIRISVMPCLAKRYFNFVIDVRITCQVDNPLQRYWCHNHPLIDLGMTTRLPLKLCRLLWIAYYGSNKKQVQLPYSRFTFRQPFSKTLLRFTSASSCSVAFLIAFSESLPTG